MGKETLESMLDLFANEWLMQMVISNPVNREKIQKVKIRPMLLKDAVVFQAEELVGTQAFHKNLTVHELKEYVRERLEADFRQAEVLSELGSAHRTGQQKRNHDGQGETDRQRGETGHDEPNRQ